MSNDCSCLFDMLRCEECRKERLNSFFRMPQSAFWRQVIASSCGTTIAILTLNPITVVKVRLQNSSAGKRRTVLSTIRKITTERGVSGFWAGTSLGMVMSVPNSVLYMTAYEHLKSTLLNCSSSTGSGIRSVVESGMISDEESISALSRSMQALSPGVAGALARGISVTAVSPLELIRTIQTGGMKQSIMNITSQLVREHGILGLYRGWWPSILRDCPFSGIYWFMFEAARSPYTHLISSLNSFSPLVTQKLVRNDDLSEGSEYRDYSVTKQNASPALVNFLSGATAGTCAAVVTHPYDVLKTQQQIATLKMNSGSNSAAAREAAEDAVAVAAQDLRGLFAQGGMQAMFRGLTMRLVTVIPASAIMVTIYEAVKSL